MGTVWAGLGGRCLCQKHGHMVMSSAVTVNSARAFLLTAGAVAVIGAVLGPSTPAQAHNYLVSSTPEASSTLTALPDQFVITTNEPLLQLSEAGGGFALEVLDAAGLFYGDGCVAVAGATMSTGAALGRAGDYTVIWQVVSGDGHSISDRFTFSWAPASDQPMSAGTSLAPDCGGAPGGNTPNSDTTPVSEPAANADLGSVLWIAGTLLALGIAIGVTLLLLGRGKQQ